MAEPGQRIDRQAEALERVDRADLRRRERLADLAPGVGEETQRPPGGDPRVELAQRAGGGVARIGEDRLARRRLARVERGEIGVRHIDFAARFEARPARRASRLRDLRRSCARWRSRPRPRSRRRASPPGRARRPRSAASRRGRRSSARRPRRAARLRRRPRKRRTRAQNSSTSSSAKTLPSDSIGTTWRTLANFSDGAAPTLRLAAIRRRRVRETRPRARYSAGAARRIRRRKSSARPRRDSAGRARRSPRRGARVRPAPRRRPAWTLSAFSSWAQN